MVAWEDRLDAVFDDVADDRMHVSFDRVELDLGPLGTLEANGGFAERMVTFFDVPREARRASIRLSGGHIGLFGPWAWSLARQA